MPSPMRWGVRLSCLAGVLGCALVCAQQLAPATTSGAAPGEISPAGPADAAEYVLGPEDQIVIHAPNAPEINDKNVRLDLRGDINMPTVGRVHAAGMTPRQLEDELVKRLKVYLEEPEVAIDVMEFKSQPVSVIGEVATPGVQQVEGRKTLIEILSQAGGVREADAGPTVKITRRIERGPIPLAGAATDASGMYSTVEIALKPLLEARTPEKNIVILPYDTISIPKAEIVYVMGEVGKPGAVPLNDAHSMTVLQAVSNSGGVLRTAMNTARILRPVDGGARRTEIAVDMKRILRGQADDVTLEPGDILFVPSSASKRATARAIEMAVSMGTMIGTYGAIR
jgi:polysaccharide biosynthesis/export protein